jgi:mRNA interferase RelE/StbE
MPKEIAYSKEVSRTLRRIPRNDAERIIAKIEQFAAGPAALGNNVKMLIGLGLIRLRVGDWRGILDDAGVALTVLKVGPRGSVYD